MEEGEAYPTEGNDSGMIVGGFSRQDENRTRRHTTDRVLTWICAGQLGLTGARLETAKLR